MDHKNFAGETKAIFDAYSHQFLVRIKCLILLVRFLDDDIRLGMILFVQVWYAIPLLGEKVFRVPLISYFRICL